MASKGAIIITAISIGLLVIYGADVAVGIGNGDGFLPFDAKVRGTALGIPAAALPIIAYFTTRKEPSKSLGVLIIISGLLTAIGPAIIVGMQDSGTMKDDTERNKMAEFGSVIAVGAFIIALGAIKIKKSSKVVSTG